MNIDELVKATRKAIAPTKRERLALAAQRSKEFNDRAEADFKAQQLTQELLDKRCTL